MQCEDVKGTIMKSITTLILSTLLLLSSNANATLMGVSYIEITNEINTWLQVAEVVALDTEGNDVALAATATATAPDQWSWKSGPEKAIDGITAGSYGAGQIFHEGSPYTNDPLTITFNSIQTLSTIQIFGRTDCCTNRDVYRVTYFDDQGSAITSAVMNAGDVTNVIPEPSTIAIFALGILGLASRRARK